MKKIDFFNTEAKKLSFVKFDNGDRLYGKFACTPMDELDNRLIFKKIFHFAFQILAYGLLIYGVYLIIGRLFGSDGYFKSIEYFTTSKKIFGILFSLISFLLSLIAIAYVYSIINNRSRKLFQKKFNNLLDYVFGHLFPTVFIILGEIIVVLAILAFLIQVLCAVSLSPIFNPLIPVFGITTSLFGGMFEFMDWDIIPLIYIDGNHFFLRPVSFEYGMRVAGSYIIFSFHMLIFTYVIVEIYKYFYKLILTIINFLPKFGIPLAIRHKYDNSKQDIDQQRSTKTIDTNDI
jgi:hypothetical protein